MSSVLSCQMCLCWLVLYFPSYEKSSNTAIACNPMSLQVLLALKLNLPLKFPEIICLMLVHCYSWCCILHCGPVSAGAQWPPRRLSPCFIYGGHKCKSYTKCARKCFLVILNPPFEILSYKCRIVYLSAFIFVFSLGHNCCVPRTWYLSMLTHLCLPQNATHGEDGRGAKWAILFTRKMSILHLAWLKTDLWKQNVTTWLEAGEDIILFFWRQKRTWTCCCWHCGAKISRTLGRDRHRHLQRTALQVAGGCREWGSHPGWPAAEHACKGCHHLPAILDAVDQRQHHGQNMAGREPIHGDTHVAWA